jgi:hemerythrin-like domain-containing protein
MDAIEMLKRQHREVAALFEQLDETTSSGERRRIFEEIADALAVHAAIEEKHFYPYVLKQGTEAILRESVEEHLQIKRVIADLLRLEPDDAAFTAKARVLQDDVERHVEEEEKGLFPAVRKLFGHEEMDVLARLMHKTQAELEAQGSPRDAVENETERAAPL